MAQNQEWILPPYAGLKDLLMGNKIYATALIRAEDFRRLGGYDENLRQFEDWEFWIRLLKDGGEVVKLPEILCAYRKRMANNSMTDNVIRYPERARLTWQQIYLKHSETYMQHGFGISDLMHHQNRCKHLKLSRWWKKIRGKSIK